MLSPEKFAAMNAKMPGLETVHLTDSEDAIIAQNIRAERRPITRSSVFSAFVQIQSDAVELVLHDTGSFELTPTDGMVISATDGNYTIQQAGVVTRMLGTRHHCLCVKQRGV